MLYCSFCDARTITAEPVMVRNQGPNQYHVRGLCKDCNWTKGKYLSQSEIKKLPLKFKQIPEKLNYFKYIKTATECIEIYPILSPIINC